jgi:uncharacterized membrane protein YbhN (UPF0104 family)
VKLKPKKIVFFSFKLAISLSLISWLIYKTDINAVVQSWGEVRWTLVISINTLLFLTAVFIRSLRINILLEHFGMKASLGWLSLIQLKGYFLRNFLPGGISAELYKAFAITRSTHQTSEAISVLIGEKIFGAFSLVLVCLSGFLLGNLNTSYDIYRDLRHPIAVVCAALLCGLLILFLLGHIFTRQNVNSSSKLINSVTRLLRISTRLVFANRHIAKILIVSILLQFVVVTWYAVISVELGLPLSYIDLLMTIPLTELLLMLPISIGGVGVREVSFVLLLTPFGVSFESAISFSLMSLFVVSIFRILSGMAFLINYEGSISTTAVKQ